MNPGWRIGIIGVVIAGMFGVLLLRLWSIQVAASDDYETLAAENQIRLVYTPAPRGDIYDRNGTLLAGSRSALAAVVDLALVEDDSFEGLTQQLSAFLDQPVSAVVERLETAPDGAQIILADDLSDAEALFLMEHREDFPGVAVIPQPVRSYPEGDLAAHVLGYIGKPDDDDLARPGVTGTDFVGKAGVERFYDDQLRGDEGILKYQVDARRNVLAQLREQDPEPGSSLVLTIDADVQRRLQDSLEDGLIFARQLEMEERATAEAALSEEDRLIAARRARADELVAQQEEDLATAEEEEASGVEEAADPRIEDPLEIDPGEVLGPLWDGLPVDVAGVCVPVQRVTITVGDEVELSGITPRSAQLTAVVGGGAQRIANVIVDGESYEAGLGDTFATNLRVAALSDDQTSILHEDKWCPVRSVGVITDPRDGSIIAMGSYPTYEPQAFVEGLTADEWSRLGVESAFTNFGVQGLYAPASTFKSVAYVMALENELYPYDRPEANVEVGADTAEGSGDDEAGGDEESAVEGSTAEPTDEVLQPEPLVSDTDKYNCTGEFIFYLNDGGVEKRRDWKWPLGHGPLDLHEALQASCDLYFWDLALRIWNERLDESGVNDEDIFQTWARAFGFGDVTRIDLPFERGGLIPDREWFTAEQRAESGRVRADGPWSGGDLMNAIVGQGAVLSTPLQLANAYAAMVNGGTVWESRVVSEILDEEGNVLAENPAEAINSVPLSDRTVADFRSDLQQVVNGELGTAKKAFQDFGENVELIGGKTGTGEVIKAPRSQQEYQADNAWFVGVAPINDPQYVVSVVVERGGSGGRVAAPISRQVLQFLINGPSAVTELAPGLEAD
jgi:cell division protein FtsI/penicillin-binding protein 2